MLKLEIKKLIKISIGQVEDINMDGIQAWLIKSKILIIQKELKCGTNVDILLNLFGYRQQNEARKMDICVLEICFKISNFQKCSTTLIYLHII